MSLLDYSLEDTVIKNRTCEVHNCNFCPYCTNSVFSIRFPLETFNCAKNALEIYHCRDCDFKTDLLIFFKKHIKQVHLTNDNGGDSQIGEYTLQSFMCQNCTFETFSSLLWLKHQQVECLLIEETKTSLTSHCFSMHEKDEIIEWYKCHLCSFKTVQRKYLKIHVLRRHCGEMSWFKCGQDEEYCNIKWHQCHSCSYKSKRKAELISHIHHRHTELEDKDLFHCDKCSYKTKTKKSLKRHNMMLHLAPEDIQWFHCDNCSFKTKDKRNLKRHNIRVHFKSEDIHWLQCDKCSFKTKYKDSLRKHNIRLHLASEEIQWFQCDKCEYKAKIKGHLKVHKSRKHCDKNKKKSKKQLSCSQCPFKTIEKYLLNNHVKHEHKSVQKTKFLECQHCSYKTGNTYNLRRHILAQHAPK